MNTIGDLARTKGGGRMSNNKYAVVDIEANGLLYDATEIHCMVIRTVDVRGTYVFSSSPMTGAPCDGSITHGVEYLRSLVASGYTIVGHNLLGYDFPLLKKLGYWYPDVFKDAKVLDTYIGVSLRHPEEKPGLDHWGQMFGIPKPVHTDWSTLSVDMIHRCEQDTRINERLLVHLQSQGYEGDEWTVARDTEQKVLWIHSQQVLHGMRVDIHELSKVLRRIDDEIRRLTVMLHKDLPKSCVNQGELKAIFKQDGTLTHHVTNWSKATGLGTWSGVLYPPSNSDVPDPKKRIRIGGPFSRIDFEPVNLSSAPALKKILFGLGWKPTQWNYKKDKSNQFERDEKGKRIKTTPKLTEDSYDSLPPGLGQNIAELLRLKHRRRFIQNETDPTKGLVGFIRNDGRVECEAFTCGTNTGRYRHSGAFVNLPKVSTPWGPEIRSLFCVPEDRFLIGIDLDGIEARMMAHYATFYDGGAFAHEVLKGDVHQMTADAMGIDSQLANAFRYAIS